LAAETVLKMPDAKFGTFRSPALPDTFRVIAEQNVVNARELFETRPYRVL
jgi:hypothetical protein